MDTDALATKPDGLAGRAAKSCIDRLNLLLRGETCRSNSKTDSDARNDRRSLEKAQVIENGQLLRSADQSIPVPSSRFPAILSRLRCGCEISSQSIGVRSVSSGPGLTTMI